jgi:hypothetical protein
MIKLFSNYPKSISFFLPLPWGYLGIYLTEIIFGICSSTTSILVMSSFSFFVIPNWLGLFFSNKKIYYIIGGIVWGSLYCIGIVTYEGMNCR